MKKNGFSHPANTSRTSEITPDRRQTSGEWFRLFSGILRGTGITLLSGILLSLLAALIAYQGDDPDALAVPFSLAALFLSLIAGGFITSRTSHQPSFLCGSGLGLVILLLQFLISGMFPESWQGNWNATPAILWLIRAGVLGFGIVGAMLGSYAPRRNRKRSRHRHV